MMFGWMDACQTKIKHYLKDSTWWRNLQICLLSSLYIFIHFSACLSLTVFSSQLCCHACPLSACQHILSVWPTFSHINKHHYPQTQNTSLVVPHLPMSPFENLPSHLTTLNFILSSEKYRFLVLLHPSDPQGCGGLPQRDQTEAVC